MDKYLTLSFMDAGVTVVLATFSIYHFFIYLGRKSYKSEQNHLFFSIICLALSIYSYSFSLWPSLFHKTALTIYAGNFEAFSITINTLALLVIIFASRGYFSRLLDWKGPKIYFWILFSLCILGYLPALMPQAAGKNLLYLLNYKRYFFLPQTYFFAAASIFTLAPFLYYVVKKRLYYRSDVLASFAGLLFILVYIFTKRILLSLQLTRFFNNPFVIVGTVLFSYALASRFNKQFKDLILLQQGLEQRVEKRTMELRETRDQLMLANTQKTEAFINLAHETRTPLTLIRFHLEKLLDRRRGDADLKALQFNILKMQRDMVNFLDSEKLKRGDIIYNHNDYVDMTLFCRNKCNFFKSYANHKDLLLESNIDENCCIKIDPSALDRILNNLLMNAIKYTEHGGVGLSLKIENDTIVCTITDTGPGIPEEDQSRIFDPYFQVSHKKKSIQGYGVGLYITHKLVEEASGSITVHCPEQAGTTFVLTFPRIKELPSKKECISAPITPELPILLNKELPRREKEDEEDGKEVILVVEDNPQLLQLLENELSKTFIVITASGGKEALRKLGYSSEPSLILSDIMMDDGDGVGFFEAVRSDNRFNAIPFIFLTALADDKTRLDLISKGAVEYIEKPFSVPELKARISSLLQNSRNQHKKAVQGAIELLHKQMTSPDHSEKTSKKVVFETRCKELELSSRQKEIVGLISQGWEYKEIAAELSISTRTVTRHVQNLYEKLEVHNKVELLNKFQ